MTYRVRAASQPTHSTLLAEPAKLIVFYTQHSFHVNTRDAQGGADDFSLTLPLSVFPPVHPCVRLSSSVSTYPTPCTWGRESESYECERGEAVTRWFVRLAHE